MLATFTTLAIVLWASAAWATLPWRFPGNIRERIQMSDLVVAGVVEETTSGARISIDGTDLENHRATLRVDRVFQGVYQPRLHFSWFSLYAPDGILYSGPPVANFRQGHRYLVFLKHDKTGWRVAVPLFAIEMELALRTSVGMPDLSTVPSESRLWAIAGELETAALQLPKPAPGTTGLAPIYMSAVHDLIGACAEPFFRHFYHEPSVELRKSAADWLALIESRHEHCQTHSP